MAFSFFKKDTLDTPYLAFINDLRSTCINNEGQELPVKRINELLRQSNVYSHVYFATLGFDRRNKQPALQTLVVNDVQAKFDRLTEKDWQTEFKGTTPTKSLLKAVLGSSQNYFTLSIKPTAFQEGLWLAEKTLPETAPYRNDKKSGEFVLATWREFLFICYRLDLARDPLFEENDLSLAELATPSTLASLLKLLNKLAAGTVSDLDLQYLFTWILQYSATINACSTLVASYNTADLPQEVIDQAAPIVEKLVSGITSISLVNDHKNADALNISEKLLAELPQLYAEASKNMAELDQKLHSDD